MISSWCFPFAARASSTALSFSSLAMIMMMMMMMLVLVTMMILMMIILLMLLVMKRIMKVILTCLPWLGSPHPASQHIALKMEVLQSEFYCHLNGDITIIIVLPSK